ncbi:hypothetical protein [Azospirillum rugosum]|uniref:Uncharacterized protein n=1 Tax=Azospirillum rugosum TaxID=416170 RepID=A0ABS4SWC3_9PROT|nr:hypothetical protein [Azospirillum rugosum]MBP2296849.1 hypothetical protein [Azospirillum rugosum]MDQ0530567.1 hypothetical protein [Azospirillum rugosum]
MLLEFGDILSTYPMTALDLGGLNVEAADYVDILAAIDDVQAPSRTSFITPNGITIVA